MSQPWGFVGRVGSKGNVFLPGGRAAEGQGACSSMPWPSAGPLRGVEVGSYSQLTEGEEPKEGLEQSRGFGTQGLDGEENKGV